MVIIDLDEEGNYVAARPSGTEPKIKFYMFTFVPCRTDRGLGVDEIRHGPQAGRNARQPPAILWSGVIDFGVFLSNELKKTTIPRTAFWDHFFSSSS